MRIEQAEQLEFIIELIKRRSWETAEDQLANWFKEEPESAVIQHLYGVICECRGEKDKAIKHYRAAYALDPSFEYASLNLERLVSGLTLRRSTTIYYGNEKLA